MSVKTLATRWPEFGVMSPFNDFFEPWNEWLHEKQHTTALSLPKVNITEKKDSFILDVAAPGLHKKDFKINVNNNLLTISAEKEDNKEEKDNKHTHREYNYSSFSRSFTIPDDVAQDKIDATYDGGILKLNLPRIEKAAPHNQKEITIK